MKESIIQRQILDYLTARRILSWRCSLGGVRLGSGRMAKNAMAGFPDIAFVLDQGQFGTIEVKAEKGRLSAAQEMWCDRLVAKNVLYILARSVEDVERCLTEYFSSHHLTETPPP